MATYTVPLVSATEATLDNFNNPLRYIQDALNQLQDKTALIYNKSAIIIYDQPIDIETGVGDLVYYNTATGQFAPAQALLNAQPGAQGQSVQAECARVIGIVIAVDGATATILCGGMYKDGAVTAACLGSDAPAGTYYLSPDTPGKAVLDPEQKLRQPVLQYMGDGKFSLSCFYLAHDGHQHASVILNSDCWRQYQDTDGVPAGSHTYDAAKDPAGHMAMAALGQISPDTTALFVSGILQTWGQVYSITDKGKLVANSGTQLTATHALMNHYPLAYGAPIVRDVTTSDALLSVERRGGIVQVNTVPYEHTTQATGRGVAIQRLQSGAAIQVPVVNAINPGVGIRVSTLNGVATVTNTIQDTKYKDATLVNLNGAVHIEQGGITYIMFPEQRTVSMSIYCPIYQTYPDNYCVKFWMQYMGGGAALKANARYIPFTAHGETVAMPDTIDLAQTDINGVDANMITTYESPVIAKKVVPGYLCAQIAMWASSNVRVLRQGFVIDQITTQVTE